jgi:hypothetical protein
MWCMSLNILEPSGSVKACNGFALPLHIKPSVNLLNVIGYCLRPDHTVAGQSSCVPSDETWMCGYDPQLNHNHCKGKPFLWPKKACHIWCKIRRLLIILIRVLCTMITLQRQNCKPKFLFESTEAFSGCRSLLWHSFVLIQQDIYSLYATNKQHKHAQFL